MTNTSKLDDASTQPQCAQECSEVRSFVDKLAGAYFREIPNRRAEPRLTLSIPVAVERLDENLHSLNVTLSGVTRDISQRGIGLLCRDPVGAKYVRLLVTSPDGQAFEVLAEVLRCTALGHYYEVGCRFLTDES